MPGSTVTGSPATASPAIGSAGGAIPVRGFVIVIASASLFGMLGPLSRFAYDAGMEPPAFVAWRAAFGFLALAAYVGWRVRDGATRLVRFGSAPDPRAGRDAGRRPRRARS